MTKPPRLKKGPWSNAVAENARWRELTYGDAKAKEFHTTSGYRVQTSDDISPRFKHDYEACNWFIEKAKGVSA